MDTGLSLDVLLRVPVGVEYDDRVGRSQVESNATRPGRQKKHKTVASFAGEVINCTLTVVTVRVAIQPLVGIT